MNEFVEKNHYVPESYLKRWGDANAKISVYRILVPNQNMPLWKKASARGLANHRHLYTQIITSEESDEIERWFNTEFESLAAASIEKAVSDNQLSPEDWKNLIRFLAAQDVRTPARMLEILKRGEKIVPEVTDNILKNLEQDLRKLKAEGNLPKPDKHNRSKLLPIKVTTDFPSNQDYVTVKVQTTVGRGYWLYCIELLLEHTIERLLKHQWTILHSPKEIDWLTSDDPVVKLNYYSPHEYDFGGGWGSVGTEIFMPLSPKHLLYTRIGSKRLQRGTVLQQKQALMFQRIIAEHAHRYIYSKSQDPLAHQFHRREVNLEIHAQEKDYWDNWHKQNIDAEQNL